MKTTKLMLVAILIAIVSFGYTQNEERPVTKKSVLISLKTALQSPKLVMAMYDQLNTEFLKPDKQVYTATLKFNRRIYYISGAQMDWTQFFRERPSNNNIPNR